ncbi:MAG: hypothetical protein D6812_06600 [Deltaproteobacteria bacterium]|nr:MAG: hypothetical protein D6812_06600 [Deltaproteobacteria bacterium]
MTATIRAHALKDVITFIKNNHEPAWVYVWPNGRLRTYPITDLEKLYRIVPDPSRITPAFLDPTPDPSPLIPYLPLLTQHLHSATHASTLDLSPSPP